jgi:pimeloyl-ACP methyl ester carboxylesterase
MLATRSWHAATVPDDARQVTLSDGRRIDVLVSGPEDGFPLVFHHGTPGARTPIRAIERAAHGHGLRLVATTRPGYGHSGRHEGRRVVDVVHDTAAVLHSLGADQCLVASWSGGGPHALACAARLPHAIAALVIAGAAPADAQGLDWMEGMGQENVDEFSAAQANPDDLRQHLDAQRDVMRNASIHDITAGLAGLLPPVDRAVLTGELAEDLAASFHEALAEGVEGWLDDHLAFVSPWGFDLHEIAVPTAIWQGSEDRMVPAAHGAWLSARIPGASAHLIPGQGHISLAVGSIDAMLDELVNAARLP